MYVYTDKVYLTTVLRFKIPEDNRLLQIKVSGSFLESKVKRMDVL